MYKAVYNLPLMSVNGSAEAQEDGSAGRERVLKRQPGIPRWNEGQGKRSRGGLPG